MVYIRVHAVAHLTSTNNKYIHTYVWLRGFSIGGLWRILPWWGFFSPFSKDFRNKSHGFLPFLMDLDRVLLCKTLYTAVNLLLQPPRGQSPSNYCTTPTLHKNTLLHQPPRGHSPSNNSAKPHFTWSNFPSLLIKFTLRNTCFAYKIPIYTSLLRAMRLANVTAEYSLYTKYPSLPAY